MRFRLFVVVLVVSLAGTAVAAGGDLLASDSIRTKPSGKKTVFKAFSAGDSVRVDMFVKKDGDLVLLKSRQPPQNFDPAGGDEVRIEVGQEGEGYTKNGGQGLLSSSKDAIYFGWDIDKKGLLDFFE